MIIYLMILHFFADFIWQSREMGTKKSTEFLWLLRHLIIQYGVLAAGLTPIFLLGIISGPKYLFMCCLNTLIHGIIDWNIWRAYKYSVVIRNPYVDPPVLKATWQYWEDHWFYTTIGFDQLLHTATLIILWNWL